MEGMTTLMRKLAILGRRWTHVQRSNSQLPRFCLEIIQRKEQLAAYMPGRVRDNCLDHETPSSRQVWPAVGT